MYRLYRATKSSLKSIEPKEIKLLKYLLNITDPEERFSALATAFSPGDDHEARDPKAVYTYGVLCWLLSLISNNSLQVILIDLLIICFFATELPRSCTSGSRLCSTHTTFIKKILRSGKPSRWPHLWLFKGYLSLNKQLKRNTLSKMSTKKTKQKIQRNCS